MWAMRVRSFAGVIDWACQVGAPKAAEIPWAQLAAYSLRSLIQAGSGHSLDCCGC